VGGRSQTPLQKRKREGKWKEEAAEMEGKRKYGLKKVASVWIDRTERISRNGENEGRG
jgi:hypothetical protein